MTSLEELESNPDWVPNQIDLPNNRVQFVKFGRTEREGRDFLALQKGQAEQWVSVGDLLAMQPLAGPVGFVFHSGFCRSTLLLRALNVPGKTTGLNEPEIFNSLARIEKPEDRLINVIVDLLSRRQDANQAVVIKPSNFPNRLIEPILKSRETAQAIVVTNSLREYLEAIVRKGLLGRRWGRSTYLIAATYAGDGSTFDSHIPGMTDLQVSALGWLFMQNWFHSLSNRGVGKRMRVLHSDHFNANRAETLTSASAFLGLGLDQTDIRGTIGGAVFSSDAKTGVDYAAKQIRDAERSKSPVVESEMAEVEQWIAEIARVSGITAPVRQTLK